jgi:hypothetical protein
VTKKLFFAKHPFYQGGFKKTRYQKNTATNRYTHVIVACYYENAKKQQKRNVYLLLFMRTVCRSSYFCPGSFGKQYPSAIAKGGNYEKSIVIPADCSSGLQPGSLCGGQFGCFQYHRHTHTAHRTRKAFGGSRASEEGRRVSAV